MFKSLQPILLVWKYWKGKFHFILIYLAKISSRKIWKGCKYMSYPCIQNIQILSVVTLISWKSISRDLRNFLLVSNQYRLLVLEIIENSTVDPWTAWFELYRSTYMWVFFHIGKFFGDLLEFERTCREPCSLQTLKKFGKICHECIKYM